MKLIKTEDAVGHVLCHDITQIIPGVVKDAVFRKGHIVTPEDIPVLLSVGKEHLYVWEKKEGILHEDEAAEILCGICLNDGMQRTKPKEGKIEIIADTDGLFKVNSVKLNQLNSLGEMMIATAHGNFPVKKGDKIAAMRIIPLVIEQEKMDRARALAGDEPLLSIMPFRRIGAGIVTTGSEIFKGRIKDAFTPVVREKLAEYGVSVIGQRTVDDDREQIVNALRELLDAGAQMLVCTGGMSVDPDDRTPGAIRAFGAKIESYGAPVLPGAMFLFGYYEHNGTDVPVMGLPGCVMYAKRTIFDLVLPRVVAGERVTGEDLWGYGEGGLCLGCGECHFPRCGFGK